MVQPPEPWLRGALPGVSPALQPVGHALVGALEDVQRAAGGLTDAQLWIQPGGAASVGFHLLHLSGSTDRLFTYARGAALSALQQSRLAAERSNPEPLPQMELLLVAWQETVHHALDQLASTTDPMLGELRTVGRAQLPSTVRGLLFHAGEHAQRHTGQIITTARIVRGLPPPGPVTQEVLQGFLDAFNRHDLDAIMGYFADDCVLYTPRGAQPRGDRFAGKHEVRAAFAKRFEGIPNVHYGEEQHCVCGDCGISEWTLTGTSVSGQRLEVRGVDLLEFARGKIIRKDSFWKSLE